MNKVSAPSSGAILRQTRRVNKFYAQIASKFHQIDIHTNNKEKKTQLRQSGLQSNPVKYCTSPTALAN